MAPSERERSQVGQPQGHTIRGRLFVLLPSPSCRQQHRQLLELALKPSALLPPRPLILGLCWALPCTQPSIGIATIGAGTRIRLPSAMHTDIVYRMYCHLYPSY